LAKVKQPTNTKTRVLSALALVALVAVLVFVRYGTDWLTSEPPADESGTVTGTVTSIADGDTFTIRADGASVKVRLLGIDAPEVAHETTPADCGGDAAKAALATLLPIGTPVTLTFDTYADRQDKYDRLLVYAATNSVDDVSLALLEAGYVEAWVPSGEPKPERWSQYKQASAAAKAAQVGSWPVCGKLGR
jgi:endonuclease YncB( thermonuclease family)